ncbi:unnamed protein product [Porites evermanni]|uniref:Uncharacterized protein n=1 Tax=Porites evermanni TaxID=104178 RepID=A0ABN8MLG0_9CNID|nr:unnamed protein product [Porites evermanni]
MKNLELVSFDNSPYVTESTGRSSGSANDSSIENQTLRRLKLNEFLSVCGRETVNQPKKSWEQLSTRTKNVRVSKAKDAVVAELKAQMPIEMLQMSKRTFKDALDKYVYLQYVRYDIFGPEREIQNHLKSMKFEYECGNFKVLQARQCPLSE